MGLAIVHGIVKSSGGFIKLESKVGQGTVFKIFIPSHKEEVKSDSDVIDTALEGQERILFVDDEVLITDMTGEMLEKLGYEVTTKNSGAAALKLFEEQSGKYDIVITDQTMPEMTGAELSKKILEIRPEIPIILCPGYSSVINKEKASEIGIKDFALKPLSKNDLGSLIRKVCDSKSA